MLPGLKAVGELLQDPFGPYLDQEVLSAECQAKSGQIPVLKSFQLAHNDEIIGLDDSEKPLGTGEPDDRVYRFRGILTIHSPLWLSEVGTKRVEGELNQRARERSMREGERVLPDMTLEQLFQKIGRYPKSLTSDDERPELKLKIQGFKSMPANYMQSKIVPHGLLWSSEDRNRRYEVATMDVHTFQLSENFFWYYRLLALMKKIVEEDPRRTSFERRTPEWFVSQYIQRFAHPSEEQGRLIYDSDDSDTLDDGTTRLPRHLKRIHKSDILRLFAAQSERFVVDNEAKRQGKLFPFKPWDRFRKAVRKARWQASRSNVTWGWPTGHEHDPDYESEPDIGGLVGGDDNDGDEDDNDDDDDDIRAVVARNPVIGKTNEVVRRRIIKAKIQPYARRVESSSSSSSSDETDPINAHAYISDFSDESSVNASDSADEGVDEHLHEFKSLVPPVLFRVPDLPGPDSRWWCRVPGCDYMIDLQNLKEENVQGLPGDSVFFLMEKKWRNIQEDKKVLLCFKRMVSIHYKTHMERLGLKLVQSRGKVKVDWIKHRRHDHHQHSQQGAIIVKKEDI